MIDAVLPLEGTHYWIGRAHGEQIKNLVRANVRSFYNILSDYGLYRETLIQQAVKDQYRLSDRRLEEIDGIAKGAGLEFPDVLAYNMYHGLAFPDECTVMIAMGSATKSGRTILAKNSDKIGRDDMVGPNFYKNKEINVVLAIRPKEGNAMIGVSSAGSTGFKMGMNDKGVMSGCNNAKTLEFRARKETGGFDAAAMRALDRVQLERDGLEYNSALEAAQAIAAHLANSPMSTPGNLQFADSKEAWFLEGSYDRLAMKVLKDGVDSRSNMFGILTDLNDPEDLSSINRYVRTQQLLKRNAGEIDVQKMIEFTMDHENGPGPNSICRHGTHYVEETSQSSAVMESNPEQPEKSTFSVCLGKPCHAWRKEGGHFTIDMTFEMSDIPESFLNGEAWKEFWTEEPYVEA